MKTQCEVCGAFVDGARVWLVRSKPAIPVTFDLTTAPVSLASRKITTCGAQVCRNLAARHEYRP